MKIEKKLWVRDWLEKLGGTEDEIKVTLYRLTYMGKSTAWHLSLKSAWGELSEAYATLKTN
jgi:acyl carrier protein phosphodiesterase